MENIWIKSKREKNRVTKDGMCRSSTIHGLCIPESDYKTGIEAVHGSSIEGL